MVIISKNTSSTDTLIAFLKRANILNFERYEEEGFHQVTIINQTYKFIFIHIPKNAGTTITKVLSDHTQWQDLELGGTIYGESIAPAYVKRFGIGKHTRAEVVRNVIGEHVWDKCFKFAFVRDPFARTLSTYQFLLKWRNWANSEIMDHFENFESFVTSRFFNEEPGPDGIFLPQWNWVCDANGSLLLDQIYKVENIDHDIRTLAAKIPLKLSEESTPKMNESEKLEKNQIFFSNVAANVIQKKYAPDFVKFGYKPSLPNLVFSQT